MEKRYRITEEEMKKCLIVQDIVSGKISLKEAQEILNLSYRQMIRLKKKFISEGIHGLLRKKSEKPNNLKVDDELRNQIVNLRII